MSPKQKKNLQYLIFLVLGVVMLYYALRDIDMPSLMTQLRKTRPFYVLMIVAMGIGSFYFRGLRWKLMLDTLGTHTRVQNVTMAVCIGYFVNLVTPRLGEIARCGIITQYEGIKLEKVAGTMVLERFVDLLTLVLLLVVALLFNAREFMLMFGDDLEQYDTQTVLMGAISLVVGGVLFYFIIKRLIAWLKRNPASWAQRLYSIMDNIRAGVTSLREMRSKSAFLFYTLLLWGSYLMMVYFGFRAVPGCEHLGIGAALLVLIFGSVGMIITPGGIGAYQLIVQNTLIKIYGIDPTLASGFALLSWALQTILIIFAGAVSWFVLPVYNNAIKDDTSTG